MVSAKTKCPTKRQKKGAASPIPAGPIGGLIESKCESPCGHSSCGHVCKVRYCGPTTHLRDHHIVHAARGAAHVWTAAIVAGLAVILTGALAYTAAEARSTAEQTASLERVTNELRDMSKKVDSLETAVSKLNVQYQRPETQ